MLKTIKVLASGSLFLVFSSLILAQDNSQLFISVKSGMVNYVEGKPLVLSTDKSEGKTVAIRDQLQAGDRVQTHRDDRIEILLNPGSYLRVAGEAQIQVLQTAFEDMHFEIIEGVAIVESATFNKKVHSLKISTPAGDLKILQDGLYRFQVSDPQQVEVLVYKGKAKWFKAQQELATLKSGKRFNLSASTAGDLQYAKLDKKKLDTVDLWSKKRAELLVAANDRLSPGLRNSAFSNYGYNYRGGWVYNPFFNCFTFVPFDFSLSSPYGFAYGNYCPIYTYRTFSDNTGYTSASGGSGGRVYEPHAGSAEQRSAVITSDSSPSSRVSTGTADVQSRGSVLQDIQTRNPEK